MKNWERDWNKLQLTLTKAQAIEELVELEAEKAQKGIQPEQELYLNRLKALIASPPGITIVAHK